MERKKKPSKIAPSAAERDAEMRRRELAHQRMVRESSSAEYARLRSGIVEGVLGGMLPCDVAELLAEARPRFPEISAAEIESLGAMGQTWANHSPATLAAIDAHCVAARRAAEPESAQRSRVLLADF